MNIISCAACAMLTGERAERIKMANVRIEETLQIFRHTCLSLSQTQTPICMMRQESSRHNRIVSTVSILHVLMLT